MKERIKQRMKGKKRRKKTIIFVIKQEKNGVQMKEINTKNEKEKRKN